MGRRLTLYFRSIDGSDFEMNVTETNSTGSRLLVGITEKHKSKTIRSVSSLGDAIMVTFRSSPVHSSSVDFVIMEGRNSFTKREEHLFGITTKSALRGCMHHAEYFNWQQVSY